MIDSNIILKISKKNNIHNYNIFNELNKNNNYGIDKLANDCKRINYEILTYLTNRIERRFV